MPCKLRDLQLLSHARDLSLYVGGCVSMCFCVCVCVNTYGFVRMGASVCIPIYSYNPLYILIYL